MLPHEFLGPEMVYYDKVLHPVLIQCCKVWHSMYLTNHRIDVDIYVVVIVTASVRRQSGNHSYELFYRGLLARGCFVSNIFLRREDASISA